MPSIALPHRAGCALWLMPLDDALQAHASALLSADERERAARFRFERDRHRFIAARSGLRELLGGHLGLAPDALRFDYGPQGKPSLVQAPDCRFNLSHSGGWGLLAIALQGEAGTDGDADPDVHDDALGVDIELVRDMPDALSLADAHFAPFDARALSELPPASRSHAFFCAWTRGESYLKALGTGFSGPGLPAVGIDAQSRRLRVAQPGSGERGVRLETFDLPQAGDACALASIARVGPVCASAAARQLAEAA